MNFIQHLIDLTTHAIQTYPEYAQWIIFLIAFIESVAILGSIFPGTLLLTPVGVMLGSQALPLMHTALSIFWGALLGDVLGFVIGKYYHTNIEHLRWVHKHKQSYAWFQEFVERHGAFALVIGRFFGPLRSSVPLFAGLLNMSTPRFLIGMFPSIILWAIAYLGPGFLIGCPSVRSYLETHLFAFVTENMYLGLFVAVVSIISFFTGKSPVSHALSKSIRTLSLFLFIGLSLDSRLIQDIDFYMMSHLQGSMPRCFAEAVSMLGEAPILLPALFMTAAYAYRTDRWELLKKKRHFGFFFLLLSLVVCVPTAKAFFARIRPEGSQLSTLLAAQCYAANRFSFPSGHMATFTALLSFGGCVIATFQKRSYRWLTYLVGATLCAVLGYARLSLGEHWFSDVLGGCFLGLTLAASARTLHLASGSEEAFSSTQKRMLWVSVLIILSYSFIRCYYV